MSGAEESSWFIKPEFDGGAFDLTPTIALFASVGVHLSPVGERAVAEEDGLPIRVRKAHPGDWQRDIPTMMKGTGPDAVVLFITEHTNQGMIDAARAEPRAMLAAIGEGRVWMDGVELPRYGRRRGPEFSSARHYEALGAARVLLLDPTPPLQEQVKRTLHLSSGDIDLALAQLMDLVALGEDKKLHVRSRRDLLQLVVDRDHGPGGLTSRWAHPGNLQDQARLVLQLGTTFISGDVAAHKYTGLGSPEHLVAYCYPAHDTDPADQSLWDLGFTPATAEDYTLEFVFPADDALRWTRPRTGNFDGYADPIVTAIDVDRIGTSGPEYEVVEALHEGVLAGAWVEDRQGDVS